MKTRTHTFHVALGILLAGCAASLGAACSGGGDSGPIIVPMNDASGNQTGSGGSGGSGGVGGSGETGGAGGSTDTGGSGGADADAADEGTVSTTPEASTNEAGTCITSPVTFQDYLNACPDSRVLGCLTFTTPLPNPLPPLP